MSVHHVHVPHLPHEVDARLQAETSATGLEPRALGALSRDKRGEGEFLPNQNGTGVQEEVHALLRAQPADDADDGPSESGCEGGEAVALRWVAERRGGEHRIVDRANPAFAMPERSGLSLRHDHDALS